MAGSRDHPRAPEQADQVPRSDDRVGRPDRPRVPEPPARADRPDTPSPVGRESRPGRLDRPTSAEDERRMRALEALPPGHPSSPYQADGTRRPPEPSLRSLELPIPDEIAEEWGIAPSGGRGKDAGSSTGYADGWYGDSADGGNWSTTELTEGNSTQAEEISNAFLLDEPWGKRGTADNTVGPSRDDNAQTTDAVPHPEAVHRNYWTEVPCFKRMWGDHESSWPKETQPAAKVDRSADPPGSWRSDSNLPLNAETHERTNGAIKEVYHAEPPVTAELQQVGQESPYGAELEGLKFRCKGEERLKEKVAETIRDNPNAPPDDVVQIIPDAIRYTFSIEKDNYTAAYWDIKDRLESRGYEMYQCNNSWDKSEYKGINTRWITPEGQRFEVQFHTQESHHAKQEITHQAYERIRNPLTSKTELQALKTFQREVSSWVPVPQGANEIQSFRK